MSTVFSTNPTLTLDIEGMSCASCVARVEKALKQVPGVTAATVNLATEHATVHLDPTVAKIDALTKAVESAGYKATLLEATSVKKEDVHALSYHHLTKELIVSAVLTVPVMALSMFSMSAAVMKTFGSMQTLNLILLAITTPILFWCGARFFRSAWATAKHFTADMNTLVAVGTGSAYFFSLVATVAPRLVSPNEMPPVYFDTTATIVTLILLGRWLETRAKTRTRDAITSLMDLSPKRARVLRDNNEIEIPFEELQTDDVVIVRPGERIAADGIILSGSSSVDESMISGESIPVEKHEGEKIIGGTINGNGTFTFRVTALGAESMLGKIIRMVEDAQGSKAPIQNLADTIAAVFVPIVIVIAVITFVGWLLAGATLTTSLINFVAVLIIACPCALGLATPTAIMVGTGAGAAHGILIKGGASLEEAHKITTVLFDKTGTVTLGKPRVTDIVTLGIDEKKLLSLARSLEARSEHPLAQAIIDRAKEEDVTTENVDSFENHPGKGVVGIVNGQRIVLGNEQLMKDFSIAVDEARSAVERFESQASSPMYLAMEGKLVGVFAVRDPIKPTTQEAVAALKNMNVTLIMITGDKKRTAEAVAHQADITQVIAEVLPSGKADAVRALQEKGEIVAMVGDGINDAPALAQANVSIAMGTGTDVALDTADIALVSGDVRGVATAIRLSHRVMRVIKQNLFWAFVYNIIGIPLAAFGLLNPMVAAAAMALSSVSVVSNSLRLKRWVG